jgi:hypothetical protein
VLDHPTVTVDRQWDVTQRQFVVDLARIIYRNIAGELPADINYLYRSQHPTEKAVLNAAEQIFEILTGDTPDYSDEEEE